MNKDNVAKIIGVILLICGGVLILEPVTTGKIEDLFAPVFFIIFGIFLIFRNQIIKSKK